jgi:hypothetical protein
MTSPDYELLYLRAGVEQFKNYLLSRELFWSLDLSAASGEPPYPQLTLGNLVLAQARVDALRLGKTLDSKQESELSRLDGEIETLKNKWQVAWERKAGQEFASRLRQWTHYLDELAQDLARHADYYGSEVRLRVLLEILGDDFGATPPVELNLVAVLDARLKVNFKEGDFLWEEDLAAGFPKEKFWYLYGSIPAER